MELIKLKIKKEAATGDNARIIKNSFIEACLNLDTNIIEPLIEEEAYFDDLDKYRFLAFLRAQFDSAKEQGLKKMIVKPGKCGLCIRGHSSFEFYGKRPKPRFAYVIKTENGEVKNIFNCNASSGWLNKN